jgi:hypothetical protein
MLDAKPTTISEAMMYLPKRTFGGEEDPSADTIGLFDYNINECKRSVE